MLKHSPIWIILIMLAATVGISQAQTKQEVQDIPEEAIGWVEGVAYAVAVRDNYAYVGFGSYFTVVDVNDKTAPVVTSTLSLPQIIEEVHLTEGIAFLLLDDLGFWVMDVIDPFNPFIIYSYLEEDLFQIVVRNQYIYGIALATLKIWDVSDLQNIQLLSSTQPDYPDLDWISDLAVEGSIAYLMNRELPNLMLYWQICRFYLMWIPVYL